MPGKIKKYLFAVPSESKNIDLAAPYLFIYC